jgi:two-component system chemotaxis response regulator CheB
VVDIARDGLEALEKIASLKPDVVTLDLVMPNLDGIGVLKSLPEQDAPRVVVVSITDTDSELAVEALSLGAVAMVQKPTALATDRLYELSRELVGAVLEAAGAAPRVLREPVRPVAPRVAEAALSSAPKQTDLVVIGTSTGGPQALTRFLAALPKNFPVPIAMALHIPAAYTAPLARRLGEHCAFDVFEAGEERPVAPGQVVLARGGIHLRMSVRDGRFYARTDPTPLTSVHSPSVDVLFESAAAAAGPRVIGVVLTGMGEDGLVGARAIRSAGGRVLTEAESSCVVYGMPRAVKDAGLSNLELPLDLLPEALLRML